MLSVNSKNPFAASSSSLESLDTDANSTINPFSAKKIDSSGKNEETERLFNSGHQKKRFRNVKNHYKYDSPAYLGSKADAASSKDYKNNQKPRKIVDPLQYDATFDYVDRLDGTHFSAFHHEGPYDACDSLFVPARQHKTVEDKKRQQDVAYHEKLEPINAFKIQRRTTFKDLDGVVDDPVVQFDVKQKDKVHGIQTLGLGSTTFLEGAPAPASAQKRK